ncbi:MAG: murein transglycosylase A [Rhodospirillales bacterium]|nr:murein transglycosylase A [Rhodospirillales bacterium]
MARRMNALRNGASAILAGAALMLLVVGCAPPPPALRLEPAPFSSLAGWADDDHDRALAAFLVSCSRLQAGAVGEAWARLGVGREALNSVCAAAAAVPLGQGDAARLFFEQNFTPALATDNGNPTGLFTGYYEPELRGAEHRGGPYQTPIFRLPDNLVTVDLGAFREDLKGQQLVGQLAGRSVVPVPTRAEIERGALSGRDLEMIWVDSAVDAFFLHIQGSGRVIMDDGRVIRLGYAGKNGRPYYAIGRELIRRGAISEEQMSMHAIRTWLSEHPQEAAEVMAKNPSFVFFRRIDGPGPVGAQNIVLTPERSLAVDPAFIPLGAPLWLETTDPLAPTPLRRLVVAQDTGGAIKGPVRGDLFWGSGAAAGDRAGAMKQTGRYYLLLPRAPAAKGATGQALSAR